jgi:hypothetical protein
MKLSAVVLAPEILKARAHARGHDFLDQFLAGHF